MRVFMTGATGFVGSHVAERLMEAGHQPVCLVRKTSNTEHLERLGVETVVGSLGDVASLGQALEGADAVIHAAGATKVRNFDDFYRINGEASGELARLACAVNPGLGRFIYISSASAQGPSDGERPRPLTAEPAPVSHYGRSKLAGERAVLECAQKMPVTIFRPPPVYGPRDHEMLAAFKMAKYGLAPVYGDGEAYLSLVYVDDLAGAIVSALQMDHPSATIFPIDDGIAHTWKSLTADIGRAMGKKPRHLQIPRFAFHAAGHISEAFGNLTRRATIFNTDKVAEMSQPSWVCGHQNLAEMLGWEPEWPLERGARHTANWYREHGWL